MNYILIWILILLIIYVISVYNGLITLRNNRENAFADIDVQLKQRFDLIPQLVDTVKWYMKHEQQTLENVTKARTEFMNSSSTDSKVQSNNMLSDALKSLFAVSENYPDLKASTNFQELQTEMSDIENKLAAARRFFNSATKEFNTKLQLFPANIIGSMLWFKEKEYFELEEDRQEVQKAPKIDFSN